MALVKTERQGIYKDGEGVLLNVDNTSLANYKARKAKENRINTLEEEVTELKGMITEVMTLLKGMSK